MFDYFIIVVRETVILTNRACEIKIYSTKKSHGGKLLRNKTINRIINKKYK